MQRRSFGIKYSLVIDIISSLTNLRKGIPQPKYKADNAPDATVEIFDHAVDEQSRPNKLEDASNHAADNQAN